MTKIDSSNMNTRGSLMTRRLFTQAAFGGLFVLGTAPELVRGAPDERLHREVLSGTEFDLHIGGASFNFTGRQRPATVVNGRLPGPLLRWREGDTVTLRVTNHLLTRSSIHWHGMIVPADMDGVPGLSFPGIASGESYRYRFKVTQHGTYWYHSHSRFQEQTGLYGPIVIEPRGGERFPAHREHVVLLSDWTDSDPEHIFAKLKKRSDYFNFHERTANDFLTDVREKGWRQTIQDRRMWGSMRMSPTDLLDVSGHAYTYLMNGVTPAGNWTGLFKRGEKVRLRFINGSSMSIFDVRIPGLKLTVVAADGQDVEPVTVDEFRIAAAETYDVMVQPTDDRAYTIFAQSMDRTGYARGTLAPRHGMEAEIPPLDPRPLLSMSDMGMAHAMSGNDRNGVDARASTDHASMNQAGHGSMTLADHASMGHAEMDHASMNHAGMDHASMGHSQMHHGADTVIPRHPGTEFVATVDARAERVSTRLDDPGVGLRDNGRHVLTYADLHTIGGPIDQRQPQRTVELHLTGHMQRFIWSFNGRKFSEAAPLRLGYGERLRITLVNDTMMTHPIHLHGMWSEVETAQGEFQARKHTVVVQPAQQLSYAVTADAPGRWAYHCHLLYHMEAGMFREVKVSDRRKPDGDLS